ncbi:MAG: GntR family transcriptional regulator [Hyphomicrobiales bacterium]|nr:MAG: GntR family transcriptional regulator [Hyphomicrobiales bacterium]
MTYDDQNTPSFQTVGSTLRSLSNHAIASPTTQVYNDLRRRIIDLELVPNTVLSRAELAKFYNVSQSPLRESLQRLERDGLIKVHPQSKTLVSAIDVQQLKETQFLRVALEIEVVSRLAETENSDVVKRASMIIRMQEACLNDESQTDMFNEIDRAFHTCLFEAVGMENLNELLVGKLGHLARCQRLELPKQGRMETIVERHREILSAIESGDAGKAAAATRHHLTGTILRISTLQTEYPEYFTASD